jgi:hypothetical protein
MAQREEEKVAVAVAGEKKLTAKDAKDGAKGAKKNGK